MRLLFLLLIPSVAWGGAFISKSDADKESGYSVYPDYARCQKAGVSDCIDLKGKDLETNSLQDVEVDDWSKPNYSAKTNMVSCKDRADCLQLHSKIAKAEKDTGTPYCANVKDHVAFSENNLMPGYSLYCWRFLGTYEKKTVQELLPDDAKIATKDAKTQAAAALNQAKSNMSFGRNLIALMNVSAASKNRSKVEVKKLLKDTAEIKSMLEAGALETAREEIIALPVGPLITQEDKDTLVGELDSYLAK